MEHTAEQLANALQTLGFQRTAYPSDKYQVFDNGTLRYLVDQNGNLRRGASVNSSVAANEAIADILTRAEKTIAQQPEQQEGHNQNQQQPHAQEQYTQNQSPQRQRSSKQQVLVDLLTRAEGATIAHIVAATDWQAHSVRGVISGVLKKKLGLHIISEKAQGGERIYRVAAENKAEPAV